MVAQNKETKLSTISSNTHHLWEFVCQQEAAMLSLGADVQSLAERAGSLQKRISSVFNTLQTENGKSESFQGIGELVRECISELEHTITSLSAERVEMDRSAQSLRLLQRRIFSLEKAARYFNVLALNMKIQAATVEGGAQLFDGMVTSTKQLAGDISDARSSIVSISGKSLEAYSQATRLLDEEIPKMEKSIENRRINLENAKQSLHDLSSHAALGSKALTEKSTIIAESISGIVVSLQFHDRMRQRTEHIAHALSLKDIPIEVEDAVVGLLLMQIEDELQLLKDISHKAQTALEEMQRQLNVIVNSILHEKNADNLKLSDLARLLIELKEIVKQSNADQVIMKALETSATEKLDLFKKSSIEVQNQLTRIRSWKVKSKVLSMNSILLAGQLGNAGVGLGVISQEIVRKSEELAFVVEEISSITEKDHAEKTEFISREITSRNMDELLQFIDSSLQKIATIQEQSTSGEFSGLLTSVNQSLQNLKVMDVMASEFIAARDSLKGLLENTTPTIGKDSNHPVFEQIKATYTMAEERKVFNEYFQIEDATEMSDSGDIELF